jgi:sulfur dioxygenase
MRAIMIFYQLIETETSTYTYLLADELTKEAVLIDPVLECVERDIKLLKEMGLNLKYILDTHVHADHITGSGELRKKTGAKTCISSKANIPCIDISLNDGDELHFGSYKIEAIETPGHTDSCMSFKVDGMIFTGDVLLIRGTGRTDFQEGSPEKMYASIQEKIFNLPGSTKIYPAHDYKGLTYSTIELEKQYNPRIGAKKSLTEFTKIMNELKLTPPKKIDIAVPANKQCGLISN